MPDPSARQQALAEYPGFPFLAADAESVERVMHLAGYIGEGQKVVTVGKAGEGNMNLTLRVGLDDGRTVILKQSRPWVEKYDTIAAPFDRAISEGRFYNVAGRIKGVAERMPELLGSDPETRTLLLKDLGEAADMTSVYRGGEFRDDELQDAASYLRALHDGTSTDSFPTGLDRAEVVPSLRNKEMRQLNHAHVLQIPLTDHGFVELDGLESGLAESAKAVRGDAEYIKAVKSLSEIYLRDDGAVLLHGDFFPGSLLRTSEGLKVIDPEFCFFGPRAFDLGILVGHLALAGRPARRAQMFLEAYDIAGGYDEVLLSRFAAVEVMRRLIGVAQLPLGETDGRRARLLRRTHGALLKGDWRLLWAS